MARKPKYSGGGILENLHRYIRENHLGWQLKDDDPCEADGIEHMPYQDLRSAEDYRTDIGSKMSLGAMPRESLE